VPEPVVEVLSPNDLARDANLKVSEYKSASEKLIWIIDRMIRIAQVHYQNRKAYTPTGTDILSGEDVLLGFVLKLSDVLPKLRKKKGKR
jgi:Uma2 family endonuclease